MTHDEPPRTDEPGRIIAHRGASRAAPENTIAAFRAAAAQGARWIEFDVSLLGDGTPVVHHDATLDRCTNRAGPVARLSRNELGAIDAGSWFSPQFRREPLPTLEDALNAIEALDLCANLEMKAHDAAPGPLAAAIAEALARRDWASRRVVVSSFDHGELFALRERMAKIPIGVLYEAPSPDWRETLARLQAEALHLDWMELDGALLEAARADGRRVRVYTLNDPIAILPFRDRLASVITDHPPLFLEDAKWAGWAAG